MSVNRYKVIAPKGLNLRAKPTTASEVRETLPKGTLLDPVDFWTTPPAGWLYVRAPSNQLGYVSTQWIEAAVEAPRADKPKPYTVEREVGELAAQYQVPYPVAWAVVRIEGGGVGFTPEGLTLIRFEPHVFRGFLSGRDLAEWGLYFQIGVGGRARWDGSGHLWRPNLSTEWRSPHGNQQERRLVLETAANINPHAAYQSMSMGAGQLMGFHYKSLGYTLPQDMFYAFSSSAKIQVAAMFSFMARRGLIEFMRRGDFLSFARAYNGSGQAERYAQLMRQVAKANGWQG